MLTYAERRPRRGVSLIEVVIAMVIAAVVLTLVSSISVRQQRLLAEIADGVAVSGQLREISTIFPTDMRSVAVAAQDIREATDTSIELRATVASAVVCDTTSNAIVLAPGSAGASTYASFTTAVEVGDTAWVFTPHDSADEWRASAIENVATVNAKGRQCAANGPRLSDSARALPRIVVALTSTPNVVGALIGSPIRVTRSIRYSLYRASDGGWYVGERDWNPTTLRFNTIQPVSGPFLSATGGGMTLVYLDSTAASLSSPVADTKRIAVIHASFRAQSKHDFTVLGSTSSSGKRLDTSTVVTLLHNRR